jgi:hypothetical protein
MEKLQNETAMYTRLVYIDTVGHVERNSMQQNDIYNIPLPRGPGPKKKNKKRQRTGINYPGWNKTSDSSRGHKISTRDGSAIDSDLTSKF